MGLLNSYTGFNPAQQPPACWFQLTNDPAGGGLFLEPIFCNAGIAIDDIKVAPYDAVNFLFAVTFPKPVPALEAGAGPILAYSGVSWWDTVVNSALDIEFISPYIVQENIAVIMKSLAGLIAGGTQVDIRTVETRVWIFPYFFLMP